LLVAVLGSPFAANANVNSLFEDNSTVAVQKTVTGTVVEESGMSLPGVSVVVKGTTVGTVTDVDGKFQIAVDESSVLVFSFVGMTTQEITVGSQSVIEVVMAADALQVDEVVVTALGIKREKKALGYAVQDVKADELNKTGDGNMLSALQGKVAGVQINESAGGVGGNSRIEIRGVSSLDGSDGPLWVVDGIPFDDGNASDGDIWGGTSRAGGSFELNPEDIESVSVLKGPNAAALYGERGGNGVVVVTTKKGSRSKGLGITYSGNVTISEVAYMLDMQDRYGQGSNGVYDADATASWGPEMQGQMLESWTGETIAFENQKDRVEDFARTGVSQKHNVTFTGGNDEGSYRLSLGKDIMNGIYEDNKVEKVTFDLRADYDINTWLNIDTKVSFFNTKGKERPELGSYSYMSYYNTMPKNIRNQDLAPGYDIIGGEHVEKMYGTVNAGNRNPYFLQAQTTNSDEKNRTFGYIAANLKLAEGLTAKLKYGMDSYHYNQTDGYLYSDLVDAATRPNYNTTKKYFKEENFEFLISYNKDINEDWTTSVSFGGNNNNRSWNSLRSTSGKLASEGDYFLGNGTNVNSTEEDSEVEVRSIYAFGQVAYKNMIFLDVTGRNDWSSTLTAKNAEFDNSYFYPSVGLSGLISEMVELPEWISFAKLRGSWAQLGKSADPYQTSQDFTVSSWNYKLLNSEVPGTLVIQDLKPEMSTSWEIGTDIRFFNNRIGLDFTYYDELTKNQILTVDVDQSTGYEQRVVNAGKITNKGVEFMLTTIPVKTKDFELGINFNFASNVTKMKELYVGDKDDETDDVTRYSFGDFNGGVELVAETGKKLGLIEGSKYSRDENGNKIVGSDGTYVVEKNQILGDVQADFTGSIGINAKYKGIYVSALFSMQQGGEIVSVTEQAATSAGTAARTDYMDRIDLFAPGVTVDGASNTKLISAQDYWGSIAGVDEEFVYDASFMKLKELAIGYSIPKSVLSKIPHNPIKNAKISLVGRNLFYVYKDTPGTTPDASAYSTSYFAKAIDFAPVPNTRTYGFSLNLGF
jgi:Outer membrane receptor proteins, mostly Fe transport